MKKKGMIIIGLVVIIVLGIFFITKDKDNKEDIIEERNKEIENQAPDFTLENLKGESVSLSDFKGKNVLINFWATWCPYCVEEMPDLNKLYNENKENDFVVLAIDVGETKGDVEKYLEDKPYEFSVLLDKDSTVANKYMVRGFPTSYMIDKEGNIQGIKMSMMTYDEMNEMLNKAKDQK